MGATSTTSRCRVTPQRTRSSPFWSTPSGPPRTTQPPACTSSSRSASRSSCPLVIDYRLAGVSRFYGCVYHACVPARSAYSPIHGVAVVNAEQVMAAATPGHVAVVGVSTGVMATLGDHLVAYPVADPLEEHLVGSCGNAGDALALDRPSDHLLGQGRTGAAHHQRCEQHRKRQHHGYPILEHRLLPLLCALGSSLFRLPVYSHTPHILAAAREQRFPQKSDEAKSLLPMTALGGPQDEPGGRSAFASAYPYAGMSHKTIPTIPTRIEHWPTSLIISGHESSSSLSLSPSSSTE